MKTIEIKSDTLIKTKGFDVSIGKRTDQVALISHSTGEFALFSSIKKGGRLAKIKRKFGKKLVSSEQFFFEGMSAEDVVSLVKMLD